MTIREYAFEGKPLPCFVVDAHTHMGPYYRSGWYQAKNETQISAVISNMDRLGVNCIVTAPHIMISGDIETANNEAAQMTAEYPGKVYGYISICPSCGMEAVKNEIEKYKNHPKFVGLKFLGGYHGSYTQKEYIYALDFADEVSCAVLAHTWNNDPPLFEFAELVSKRPSLKMLCAHQGGGYAHLTRNLASIMKNVPNIYMEICGSLTNTLSIEEITDMVGIDRVIYGSDMINLDPRYDFGRVALSTLSDEIKEKIFSRNFLRLLEGSSMGQIEKNV